MSAAAIQGLDPHLAQLLASDELYFRLASEVEFRGDCELVYTPGFTHVPAGCVVQAVRFEGSTTNAQGWLDGIEREVHRVGASLCRLYLSAGPTPLTSVLASRGYRSRRETAFCASPRQLETKSNVIFHPVTCSKHWEERLRMHEEDPENSDGYIVDPKSWCALIQAKCATRIKESFLIEYRGEICGSIAVIQMGNLLRFKNLMIRPAFRRRGLGHEVIRQLAALANGRRLDALGAFGIEGEAGAKLYRAARLSGIGFQTEWSRRL